MSDSNSNSFDKIITDIGLEKAAAFDGSQVDYEPTIEDFSPNPQLLKNIREFIDNQYSDEVFLSQRSKEEFNETIGTIQNYKKELLDLIRSEEIRAVYRDSVKEYIMDLVEELNNLLDDLEEPINLLESES